VRTENDLSAALESLERHAPRLAAVLPPAACASTGRRGSPSRRRWPRAIGPLAAALAVVVAVVTPLAVGRIFKPGGQPASGVSIAAGSTAAQALATLARAAAAQPAQSGEYRRVSAFSGNIMASGPNEHPYLIDERDSLSTTWYPVSSGAKVVSYANRELTSVLPTAGATAAWQADHQPALPSRANKEIPYSDFQGGDIGLPYFGGETLTSAQYQALPASASGLKAAISRAAKKISPPLPGQPARLADQGIFEICLALIQLDPVTSAVRAAALNVLATLPSVQFDGAVTDSLGRGGYAFSMTPSVYALDWGLGFGAGVPEGTDIKGYLPLRIVLSPSGTLLDEQWVTPSPTLSRLDSFPASGAIPGPASCPSGYYSYGQGTGCTEDGNVVKGSASTGFDITGPHGGPAKGNYPDFLNQPIVAVPAGTVLEYRAYVDSGWTNATPSAAGSAQAIPGQ
jgi:hypothetical protein